MTSEENEVFNKDVVEYLRKSFPDPEGNSHFEKLLQTLTTPPLFTTLRTSLRNKNELKTVLDAELAKQSSMVQWEYFEHFLHPAFKDCVIIRNNGPFQLEKPVQEIIVDVSCGMAVLRGANVFKQGILGASHGLKKGDQVGVYADLDGKCLKGNASCYQGQRLHVGNGTSQVSRSDLFNSKEVQSGIGILMVDPLYRAPSLSDLDTNIFFPQNLPSIVCVHALDPQPGEIILDMCAAPGGKTTHIASLMGGQGRVIALEKSRERMTRMVEMLNRMAFDIINTFVFDSTKAVSSDDAGEDNAPPYLPATFDRILLDAPCSALGQRPCLANRVSLNQLKSYPVIQRKLLLAAVRLLKPGGVLVYSTCTLPKEENEDQVSHVLLSRPDMELVQIPFMCSSPGLTSSQLSLEERSKVLRFDPARTKNDLDSWDKDTIAFFIAKFRKKSSSELSSSC